MIFAVLVGMVVGAVGYAPYLFAKNRSRHTDPSNPLGYTGWFLFAILVSFLLLFVGIVVCGMLAKDVLLPFAIAEIAVLFALVMFFGLVKDRKSVV